MLSSFRSRLLLAFVLLIGSALTATISLVVPYTRQSIINNAERELDISFNRFKTLLADDNKLRRAQIAFLLSDKNFKQAIANANLNDLTNIMRSYDKFIEADMILLCDASGRIVLSTDPDAITNNDLQILNREQPNTVEMFTVSNQKPYQVFIMPVMAPNLIAWIGIGAAIDQAWLDNFKKITTTDITLNFSDGEYAYSLSNRDKSTVMDKTVQVTSELSGTANHAIISVVLSTPTREKLEPFNPLLQKIIYIGLAALLLATIASLFIARGISRPIQSLSKAAKRIAKGNYSEKIDITGKNEFGQLGQALNHMRQAINDREQHISYQANHDLLTGIPNRNYLENWVKDLLREDTPTSPFCLAIVHIYNLNQLIDLYGGDICDQLIKKIALSIKSVLHDDDHIARFDSNQFLLFLANTDTQNAESQCSHILNIAGQNYPSGPIELSPEVRIGVACYPDHGLRYDELLRRASIALSNAHNHKQDFYLYRSGEDDAHLRKVRITYRLQNAIKTAGLSLLYQPQLDLRTQKIERVEALLRWHDQELGDISPDEFVPLAERSGDISTITKWMFDRVVQQIVEWRSIGIDLGVSVNLSARDIKNADFINHILATIEMYHLEPSDLAFEVTESAVLEHREISIANLQELRSYGMHIAMDDFGTGFSSLSQLKTLPISELKIDKSFILNIHQDSDDQKIVSTIIGMAHQFGLDVITEGVKDRAGLELLKELGSDIVQGYYLTKPLSAEDLKQWLMLMGYADNKNVASIF